MLLIHFRVIDRDGIYYYKHIYLEKRAILSRQLFRGIPDLASLELSYKWEFYLNKGIHC